MKIGELARRSGLPVSTLRFYADQGLLDSQRSSGNYRRFAPGSLQQLQCIQALRSLNLGLPEIRQILHWRSTPQESCAAMCRLVETHRLRIRQQREALERLERQLEQWGQLCTGQGPCQILASIG